MYFCVYWLNKHVFPNKSKRLKLEWIPLVETLYSFDDVATRLFLIAYLYHFLYEMTKGEPFETNLNGPTRWSSYGCSGTSPSFECQTWSSPKEWLLSASWSRHLPPTTPPSFAYISSEFARLGQTWSGVLQYSEGIHGFKTKNDAFGEDTNSFCKEKFMSCIQQLDLA